MKGIQILTEKNKKEVKEHGSYTFPVQVSPEAIQSYEQHSFMWHWHPEIELTWFVSGQMEYVVNDQRYIISEGEGIFCNSNALHAGYMMTRTVIISLSHFIPNSSMATRTVSCRPNMSILSLPTNSGLHLY